MAPVSPRHRLSTALLACIALLAMLAAPSAASPISYHATFQRGAIVPIPDTVPHARGAMVDRRIVGNLEYLAANYPIYIEEGYAGPLAGVGQVGCRKCHVEHSDHYNGLAVDILPLDWDRKGCDNSWRPITRLARWAEPRQNHPRLPFRFVGYNGDVNHGCGNHLHLSWDHAPAARFAIARWVTVLDPPLSAIPPTLPGTPTIESAPPPVFPPRG
jgi:hypothetical protein